MKKIKFEHKLTAQFKKTQAELVKAERAWRNAVGKSSRIGNKIYQQCILHAQKLNLRENKKNHPKYTLYPYYIPDANGDIFEAYRIAGVTYEDFTQHNVPTHGTYDRCRNVFTNKEGATAALEALSEKLNLKNPGNYENFQTELQELKKKYGIQ